MSPATRGTPAGADAGLRDQLLAAIPSLRAVALALTGDAGRADDLVQDTLLRSWAATERIPYGPDLAPWLIVGMRERFRSAQGRGAGADASTRDGA